MKPLFTLLFFFVCSFSFAQSTDLTAEQQKMLKNEIEKESSALKQKLLKSNTNVTELEFTLDTFKIERFCAKYLKLNNTDYGMRAAAYETADKYDTLLNKYYQKLLRVIKGDDKKVLIQAQKSWLIFRDNEMKLIETISKDEYSGGGTIQRLTEACEYMKMIKERVLVIFHHLARATQVY